MWAVPTRHISENHPSKEALDGFEHWGLFSPVHARLYSLRPYALIRSPATLVWSLSLQASPGNVVGAACLMGSACSARMVARRRSTRRARGALFAAEACDLRTRSPRIKRLPTWGSPYKVPIWESREASVTLGPAYLGPLDPKR